MQLRAAHATGSSHLAPDVTVLCKFHHDVQVILLGESVAVADDVAVLDRSKDADLVEGVLPAAAQASGGVLTAPIEQIIREMPGGAPLARVKLADVDLLYCVAGTGAPNGKVHQHDTGIAA